MHRNRQDDDRQDGAVLEHALGYAARGWSIIPITAGKKAEHVGATVAGAIAEAKPNANIGNAGR